MWQVASADNQRMRETVRKSIRKLKEHASLRAVIEAEDDENDDVLLTKDLVMCDSDAEK